LEKTTTSIENFYIREATKKDVPTILQFIRELAEHEGLLEEVKASEDSLTEHLFGENPRAQVIFGCIENEPIAFALFFYNFSTFEGKPGVHLEDLYVKPAHRGKGIGKIILSYLAHLTLQIGGRRLEWCVHTWNTKAQAFYKAIGAKPQNRIILNRLDGNELTDLASTFRKLHIGKT